MSRPLTGAARQAFGSFVRAYATHSMDTKGIFRVQVKTISSPALPCAPLSYPFLSSILFYPLPVLPYPDVDPFSSSILFTAVPYLILSCLALPCLALPCLALPCLALPCPTLFLSVLPSFILFKLASLHLIIRIASSPAPSYPPIVYYPVLPYLAPSLCT